MKIAITFLLMTAFLNQAFTEDTEYGLAIGVVAPNKATFPTYASNVTVISPASSTDNAGSAVQNYASGFTLDLRVKNTYSKKWGFWFGLKYISPVSLTFSTIKGTNGSTDTNYLGPYDTLQSNDFNANLFYIFDDSYIALGLNQSAHVYNPVPISGFQVKTSATGGLGYQLSLGIMLLKEIHLEVALVQHALAISGSATAANGSVQYTLSGGNMLSTAASLVLMF